MLRILKVVFFLCLVSLLSVNNMTQAQEITETQWYFGNSSEALIFDKSSRGFELFEDQAVPFGTRGSTVITHPRKGNLLFYSDGSSIYDGSHQIIPGLGSNLLGADQSKIQPVVSCPVPGDTSQYFIFTNSGSAIDITTVDASIQGNSTVAQFPLGDIDGTIAQPTGLVNQGELLKIIENPAANTFWLLTQDSITHEFLISEVVSGGIDSIRVYDMFAGGIPTFEASGAAVKLDSAGNTIIAVASLRADRNAILLDFDPTTGDLSFIQQVVNTGFSDVSDQVIFDIEWSNDGSKLYLSRTGDGTNPGDIYQVDLSDTVNLTPPVLPVINNNLFASYGLKRAVDGNLYHLYQLSAGGEFLLGSINRPDSSIASEVLYSESILDTDFQGVQFPEFAPDNFVSGYFDMTFTYLDSCFGSATKFIANVSPLPNNYFWNFGDGSFGQGPVAIHTYAEQFGGLVELIVDLDGNFQSLGRPIDIFASDSTLDLGNDTTICIDETLLLDAGEGDSYLWSTGELTQTITIDTAGTYWVEVLANGCTAFDEIEVTEYGLQRQLFNQWYFGDMAGLDFNTSPPTALTDGIIESPEGCATVSGQDGLLLFYTNGSTVWNKDHEIMINGTNIGGDSTAAQSAIILPLPDDNTMFYIVTTEEVYGDFTFNAKVTIVDMKADSARGKVSVKNIPFIECSTERVTASAFTGSPWLMTHEYGNRHFRGYRVSNTGISNPIHSAVGEEHIFQDETEATGYMKFSASRNLVATLVPGSPNRIDILNFDNITGALSNSRVIDIQETDQAYGLEFSQDDLKLYVSTSSKILQYDLDSINSDNPEVDIMATKFEMSNAVTGGYGSLQMGPDGLIYVAMDGQTSLGVINAPGADDDAVSYQEGAAGQDLLGRTSRLGLPNFTQQVSESPQLPGITTQVACAGLPTSFSGVGRDSSIETYLWDFGDTTVFSTEQNPIHTYFNPGTYVVSLTLSNRCDTDTVMMDTVEVFNIPQIPTVPTDTSLCGGEITLSAWDVDEPAFSYYWSTGDTTRSVVFSEPATVMVAIINSDGCSSDTLTVFIGEDESFIDLGPDLLICSSDSLVLDTNDPGPNYAWYRDGILIGTERTQAIFDVPAGNYTYVGEVTDDISGCTYRDTVEVEIQPSPIFNQVDIVTPNCGDSDGEFALDFTNAGSYIYSLEDSVGSERFTFDGPGVTPPFTGLAAGTYTVRVENAVTGCSDLELVQLEDNAPFDMTATASNSCARTSDIIINFTDQVPARVEIDVRDESGLSVFSTTEDLFSSRYEVSDLDTGRYFIEVRDLLPPGCLQTDTVQLSVSNECYLTLFVPNAFTPNGDPLNNEWFVFPNEFVDEFEIFILNRWGDVVYTSRDQNFRWSGEFAGGEVILGTYAYRILFTSTLEPDLGTIEQFGSVTVIK